jgi:preprotein translocase subunit SecD
VLTIGMAVDANVLVFERIREELRVNKSPARAIELGYERALSAIIDANITTFITAVVLFTVGAGPVRGFAITLGIGIITSVFTALFVTRFIVELWFGWRRPKTVAL